MQNGKKCFVIRKLSAAYLVTLEGLDVVVKPIHNSNFTSASLTIARSLQIVGQSRLHLRKPHDYLQYLKDFYDEKGWNIEEVD